MIVLHRAPKPLGEEVVHQPPLAVDADRNTFFPQNASELLADELGAP
jgi:hypothetical protein